MSRKTNKKTRIYKNNLGKRAVSHASLGPVMCGNEFKPILNKVNSNDFIPERNGFKKAYDQRQIIMKLSESRNKITS